MLAFPKNWQNQPRHIISESIGDRSKDQGTTNQRLAIAWRHIRWKGCCCIAFRFSAGSRLFCAAVAHTMLENLPTGACPPKPQASKKRSSIPEIPCICNFFLLWMPPNWESKEWVGSPKKKAWRVEVTFWCWGTLDLLPFHFPTFGCFAIVIIFLIKIKLTFGVLGRGLFCLEKSCLQIVWFTLLRNMLLPRFWWGSLFPACVGQLLQQ